MNELPRITHNLTTTTIKPSFLLYARNLHHIHLTLAPDGKCGTNNVVYNTVHCVWQNHSLDAKNAYTVKPSDFWQFFGLRVPSHITF